MRLDIGYVTVSNRLLFLFLILVSLLSCHPLYLSFFYKYLCICTCIYRPIHFLRAPFSENWSWSRLGSSNISLVFLTVTNQDFSAASFFLFSFPRVILNSGLYWLERLPMPIYHSFSAACLSPSLPSISLILCVWRSCSFLSFHIVWHSIHPTLIAFDDHTFPVRLLF